MIPLGRGAVVAFLVAGLTVTTVGAEGCGDTISSTPAAAHHAKRHHKRKRTHHKRHHRRHVSRPVIAAPPPPKAPPPPPPPPPTQPAQPQCDPNYTGACLDPNASDYDCAGGSGNGPKYVQGPIQVVGTDHYGLDRDGDGTACDQ
jgi:hypothetical protein